MQQDNNILETKSHFRLVRLGTRIWDMPSNSLPSRFLSEIDLDVLPKLMICGHLDLLRHNSRYEMLWKHIAMESMPENELPVLHNTYLRRCSKRTRNVTATS